ncbi:MAG TPA: hypothetical protein DIS66_07885 [Candidatus Omnitrophica bacterium]|nr:hypothetical protein [Candidatus Omnitrophota bacterium]
MRRASCGAGMKPGLPQNPKILVTRTDRIGDLVVSTPIFELIKKKHPKSHLAACVFSEHCELVSGNPFVDEVILYEKKDAQKNWIGQWRFAREIHAKKFDAVIHLHATNRMHIMSLFAEVPIRIGYNRRAPWALTQVFPYDKKEGLKHETNYLTDLVCASGFSSQPAEPVLPYVPVTQGNRLSVSNLLQHLGVEANEPIAVIHPSASDVSKMWPVENFSEFLKQYVSGKVRWIAVGDAKAAEQTAIISKLSGLLVLDLCGKLSLGMLAALFEKAKLVVSNDSGPAHIAAAVGAPTVSIFGRWQPGMNAERWKPNGKKAIVVTPQIESIPVAERAFTYVDRISVEQVLDAAKKVTP